MGSVRRVCVLRSGGEYGPEHVQWLAKMVPGLECISDVDVPGVPCIPLRHDWPGWWSKLELFRHDIPGDLSYIDLDTVVLGDIAPIIAAANGKTTMLSDFYWPEKPASGLMYIAQQDKAQVWGEWMRDPAGHMNAPVSRGVIGDQGYLGKILPGVQRWQDVAPGSVVSYKAHCKQGVPDSATVVCFHGKPRPWDCGEEWVPEL